MNAAEGNDAARRGKNRQARQERQGSDSPEFRNQNPELLMRREDHG